MTLPSAFSSFGHFFAAGLKRDKLFFLIAPDCTKHAMTSAGLCALTSFLKGLWTLSISHTVAVAMNI